jgi:hypothetical protein
MVLIFLIIAFSIYRSRYLEAKSNPSNWCHADWICGDSTASEDGTFVKGQMEAPILDLIPLMYACRSENFSLTDADTSDLTANLVKGSSNIPGKVPCVCPIMLDVDYELGSNLGLTGLDAYKMHPAKDTKREMFICDNMFSGAGSIDPKQKDAETKSGTVGGPCKVEDCQELWKNWATFTDRGGETDKYVPGQLTSIKDIRPGTTAKWWWGTKRDFIDVERERAPPGPWANFVDTNDDTLFPLYKVSTILGQK